MGFVSYAEDNAERAYDRLFMAGRIYPAVSVRTLEVLSPAPVRPALAPQPCSLNKKDGLTARELHIICLAELRPRSKFH